jgi:hypothetical protein
VNRFRETYGELFDVLDSDWFPDESWEKITSAALAEIEDRGCGDLCVPIFGQYDDSLDDDDPCRLTAVDLHRARMRRSFRHIRTG